MSQARLFPADPHVEPLGAVAARVMDVAMVEAKLRMIATLEAGEIEGWIKARRYDQRPWFDGERAALARRAKRLGVEL